MRSSLANCRLPFHHSPSKPHIAAFLDRETAKIDGLVAEQRRLMELLKEKRQAVISHAVTKGLNPHAPMKPSGIEWLGDVPAHWNVIAVKREFDQGWQVLDRFGDPQNSDEMGERLMNGCVTSNGVTSRSENNVH